MIKKQLLVLQISIIQIVTNPRKTLFFSPFISSIQLDPSQIGFRVGSVLDESMQKKEVNTAILSHQKLPWGTSWRGLEVENHQ